MLEHESPLSVSSAFGFRFAIFFFQSKRENEQNDVFILKLI